MECSFSYVSRRAVCLLLPDRSVGGTYGEKKTFETVSGTDKEFPRHTMISRGGASNRDGVATGAGAGAYDRGVSKRMARIRVRIPERKTTRMRVVNFENVRFKLKKRSTGVFFGSKRPCATSRCRCQVCARPTHTNACTHDAIVGVFLFRISLFA